MQDIYQKLNKDYSIDELVENLVNVPGEEIANLLAELDINIPRSIRFNALQKVLFPVLEQEYNDLLKAESDVEGPERLEESRRQTRLRWIDSFSETQFENELFKFNDKDLDKKYLFEFWKRLIIFLLKEGVPKQTLAAFIERFIQKYQSNQGTPPTRLFNKAIEPFIYDEEGTFDGLIRSLFAKRVVLSATISELKQIGSKYGIKVPTRLTKIQVLEIVINELKDRNEYIPEVHSELNDFNLKELEDFARLNNIIAFAYINKDQMIEYMYKEYDEKGIQVKRFKKEEEIEVELEEEIVAIEEKEEVAPKVEKEVEIIPEIKKSEDVIKDIEEDVEVISKEEVTEKIIQVETEPSAAVVHYDSQKMDDLKKEILSLKEIFLDLQREVKELKEESKKTDGKLDKISKGLVPKWFKRIVLILFIIFMFFLIYVPLSYYYPTAPIVSQISYVFSRIPFFGGRDFLEFLHSAFERIFGM
jgi:hypothetical protein